MNTQFSFFECVEAGMAVKGYEASVKTDGEIVESGGVALLAFAAAIDYGNAFASEPFDEAKEKQARARLTELLVQPESVDEYLQEVTEMLESFYDTGN